MYKLVKTSHNNFLDQKECCISNNDEDILIFYLKDDSLKINILEIDICHVANHSCERLYDGRFNVFDLSKFNIMIETKKIKKYYFAQITYQYYKSLDKYLYGKIHVFRFDDDKCKVLYDGIGYGQGGGTGDEIPIIDEMQEMHDKLIFGDFNTEYDKFSNTVNFTFPDSNYNHNYEIRLLNFKEFSSEETMLPNKKYIIGFANNKIICAFLISCSNPKNKLIKKIIDEEKLIQSFFPDMTNHKIIVCENI